MGKFSGMKTVAFEAPPPATPDDLRALRERIGLTRMSMAQLFNVSYSTYRRWETGRAAIPAIVDRMVSWLEDGYVPPELHATGMTGALV